MSVLVDTSALYALLVRDDSNHEAAEGAFGGIRERSPLVTHSYVVVETVSLLQHRFGVAAVHRLVDLLSPVEIVWVSEELHKPAMAALLAAPSRQLSLVDRVSFELMRDRAIAEAFAFDRDFGKEGFATIPA